MSFFYYFCYVGHVILALKVNKIRPNILQKTTFQTLPQLGWISVPTWLHFGMVVGDKMGSSWVQMALRIDSKNKLKNDYLLNGFKIDFKRPQRGRKHSGQWGKLSLFGGLLVSRGLLKPRWPPNPSKTAHKLYVDGFVIEC